MTDNRLQTGSRRNYGHPVSASLIQNLPPTTLMRIFFARRLQP